MNNFSLRTARESDAAELSRIYAHYVENTNISFEDQAPEPEAFAQRVRAVSRRYPFLVCEHEGRPAGYAYLFRHMERAAYQWNAEISAYVHKDYRSRGYGGALAAALIEIALLQNLHTLYAIVALPNPASEGLCARFGFRRQAVFAATGYKNGQWIDTAWFEKRLRPATVPSPLRPFPALEPETVRNILENALK